MCGRYSFAHIREEIEDRFGLHTDGAKYYLPTYNAAPGQKHPIILNDEPSKFSFFYFGLVPSWTKALSRKALINARSETVFEKTSFKSLILRRRCLIPADSFYEWKKQGKSSVPFRIFLNNSPLFAFAGIWDQWKNEQQEIYHSFSIITVPASGKMKDIHHRMPLILPQEKEKIWLSLKTPQSEVRRIMQCGATDLKYYPVNPRINKTNNNDKGLWEFFDPMDSIGGLFS